jgi:hypothetical protein
VLALSEAGAAHVATHRQSYPRVLPERTFKVRNPDIARTRPARYGTQTLTIRDPAKTLATTVIRADPVSGIGTLI